MNKKKNVLIIGGSSSLGKSLIDTFLKRKYQICSTYNNNRSDLNKSITNVHLNLKSMESINLFFEFLNQKTSFDIVIFLPALLYGKKLDDYSLLEINECMDINFNLHAFILGKILNKLSNKCCVLFVSSISGEKGSFDPIYAASKGAQIAFVKSLSNWLSPKIRINVISPSLIKDSKMYFQMDEKRQNYHKFINPMKKLLTKEDLSEIIFDISLKHWSHMNGQVISINGGQYS